MKQLTSLSDQSAIIRTQITLTRAVKEAVEKKAKEKNISLSEYLRQAALLSLLLDKNKEESLEDLAHRVVGSVDLRKHFRWQTLSKTALWARNIRKEWEKRS